MNVQQEGVRRLIKRIQDGGIGLALWEGKCIVESQVQPVWQRALLNDFPKLECRYLRMESDFLCLHDT